MKGNTLTQKHFLFIQIQLIRFGRYKQEEIMWKSRDTSYCKTVSSALRQTCGSARAEADDIADLVLSHFCIFLRAGRLFKIRYLHKSVFVEALHLAASLPCNHNMSRILDYLLKIGVESRPSLQEENIPVPWQLSLLCSIRLAHGGQWTVLRKASKHDSAVLLPVSSAVFIKRENIFMILSFHGESSGD